MIAPKSPNSKEKYSFCLSHVKEYNKRWNFFAGKSQSQIYDYQKNDFLLVVQLDLFQRELVQKLNLNLNILLIMKI